MTKSRPHQPESHFVQRLGWLRAAVLGANDGIVSTASLIMGVASAGSSSHDVLLAGTAGLVSGALSMAAGEYVSVSSQADSERSDLAREREELANQVEAEHEELAEIYVTRGLEPALAREVASQLMAHDALAAHARDELGISEVGQAQPLQAALSSAAAFSMGAAVPLGVVLVAPATSLAPATLAVSLTALGAMGALSAWTGGAPIWRAALRVTAWGALAMAATAAIGSLFGTTVA